MSAQQHAPADTGAAGRVEDVAALARLALAWQHRLDGLPGNIDPSWLDKLGLQAWTSVPLPAGEARRRLMTGLFQRWCGALPALTELVPAASGLALLARPTLLARLCALALLRRPGVLRCCIERRTRQALENALGAAFAPLQDQNGSGTYTPGEAANWAPIQWASVGYADLVLARAWSHASLRRLVRLALPSVGEMRADVRQLPASIIPVHRGLAGLDPLFEGKAPW